MNLQHKLYAHMPEAYERLRNSFFMPVQMVRRRRFSGTQRDERRKLRLKTLAYTVLHFPRLGSAYFSATP